MNIFKNMGKTLSGSTVNYCEKPALLNYERLMKEYGGLSTSYANNTPFPHIVVDNFLDENVFRAVAKAFPAPEDMVWMSGEAQTDNGKDAQIKKLQFALGRYNLTNELMLPPIIRYLLLELNSATFIRLLSRLTKIDNLISDPRMWGGGLHQTTRGGMLRVHADFLEHPEFNLRRRLNVLLFMNEDWKEEYGGNLELWSQDMQRCEKTVLPIANRCLIFNTDRHSYHGYTKPIQCPESEARKSIAMYYYTMPDVGERPTPETYWQDLPEERTD
jgi:hypothetical protein